MDIVTEKDLSGKEIIEKLRLSVRHSDHEYSLVPYMFHDVPLWMCDVVSPMKIFQFHTTRVLQELLLAIFRTIENFL